MVVQPPLPFVPSMTASPPASTLSFRAPREGFIVRLLPEVVAHFSQHRQIRSRAPEVGGQLFAEFRNGEVIVQKATGPNRSDRHGWAWFVPNQRRQNAEIRQLFDSGLHFIGDWHTHPEARPKPSQLDLDSMADCFRRSKHQLRAFLMAIVGTDSFPEGLWLSLHPREGFERLTVFPDQADPTPAKTK